MSTRQSMTEAHNLLHGGETQVWCDAGCRMGREVEWQVAMRPGKRLSTLRFSVRAKVEHPFLKVKRIFGYCKVRYRGLAKNTERLALLFGLGNLLTAEGQLAG